MEGNIDNDDNEREIGTNFVGSLDHSCDGLGSLEPSVDDFIAELLVAQMGGGGRRRLREHRSAARRIVSEIYSPTRVTQMIKDKKMRHILPGFAFA